MTRAPRLFVQPFDMNYLGQPPMFKAWWSTIGLGRLHGTAKSSYFVWRDLFRSAVPHLTRP